MPIIVVLLYVTLHESVRAYMYVYWVGVCVRTCMCTGWVCACVRACVHVCVLGGWVRACVCAGWVCAILLKSKKFHINIVYCRLYLFKMNVCVCVRACVRACVRVCMCIYINVQTVAKALI